MLKFGEITKRPVNVLKIAVSKEVMTLLYVISI